MTVEEYTQEELSVLVGATIVEVNVGPDEISGSRNPLVTLKVRYRPFLEVNGSHGGLYGIWMDEEGNGPGHIAFLGASDEV